MKKAFVWTMVLSAVVVTAAGCHQKEHKVKYENEPEVIYITEPPPPLIVEKCPPCPTKNYVWVNGYWSCNGKKYVWKKGCWVPPRHKGEYWIEPRYDKHKKGYHYTPGHWDKKPPKHHDKPKKHHDKPKKHHDKPKKHHDKKPKRRD